MHELTPEIKERLITRLKETRVNPYDRTVAKVMRKFKKRQLHSGQGKNKEKPPKGKIVQTREQAIAIALSEAKKKHGARLSSRRKEYKGDGVMVAFMLPDNIARILHRLAGMPGGLPPKELHVTLGYLGNTKDLQEKKQEVINALYDFAAKQKKPIKGTISGTGQWQADDGKTCVYASFDSPDLLDFQQALVKTLPVKVASNHGYTPHITLAYINHEDRPYASDYVSYPQIDIPPIDVTFDKITLGFGSEYLSVPFAQTTTKEYKWLTSYKEISEKAYKVLVGKRGGKYYFNKAGKKIYGTPPVLMREDRAKRTGALKKFLENATPEQIAKTRSDLEKKLATAREKGDKEGIIKARASLAVLPKDKVKLPKQAERDFDVLGNSKYASVNDVKQDIKRYNDITEEQVKLFEPYNQRGNKFTPKKEVPNDVADKGRKLEQESRNLRKKLQELPPVTLATLSMQDLENRKKKPTTRDIAARAREALQYPKQGGKPRAGNLGSVGLNSPEIKAVQNSINSTEKKIANLEKEIEPKRKQYDELDKILQPLVEKQYEVSRERDSVRNKMYKLQTAALVRGNADAKDAYVKLKAERDRLNAEVERLAQDMDSKGWDEYMDLQTDLDSLEPYRDDLKEQLQFLKEDLQEAKRKAKIAREKPLSEEDWLKRTFGSDYKKQQEDYEKQQREEKRKAEEVRLQAEEAARKRKEDAENAIRQRQAIEDRNELYKGVPENFEALRFYSPEKRRSILAKLDKQMMENYRNGVYDSYLARQRNDFIAKMTELEEGQKIKVPDNQAQLFEPKFRGKKTKIPYVPKKQKEAFPNPTNFTVFKEKATGKYRWLTITSTAFRDRDGEIITRKSFDQVTNYMRETGNYGDFRFWHTGVKLGTCDHSSLLGRCLIESGTFNDNATAIAFKEFAKSNPLGMSPGFKHPATEPDRDGHYHNIYIFERSVLPLEKASNPFTRFAVSG